MGPYFNIATYFSGRSDDTGSLRQYFQSGKTFFSITKHFSSIIEENQDDPEKVVHFLARYDQAIRVAISLQPEGVKKEGFAKAVEKVTALGRKVFKIPPEPNPFSVSLDIAQHRLEFAKSNQLKTPLETLIQIGCKHGKLDLLKELDFIGANFNFHIGITNTWPIHEAAQNAEEEVCLWLIRTKGADLTQSVIPSFMHPIHWACKYTLFKLVKELLDRGVYPNQGNKLNSSPLHYACASSIQGMRSRMEAHRHARLALYLYAHGAWPTLIDSEKQKPINYFGKEGVLIIKGAFKSLEVAQNTFGVPKDVWKLIFRQLLPSDLFSAHRVCRNWRHIISTDLAESFIAERIWRISEHHL